MSPGNGSRDFDLPLALALADAQKGVPFGAPRWRDQWVRAGSVVDRLRYDEPWRGIGPRLASMERRGLVESQNRDASWDLRQRYDVTWRLSARGRRLIRGHAR